MCRTIALGILLLWFAPLSGQTPFSLESVLSAPYCSNLTGSPDGEAIAWVEEKAGVRTLYAAESPGFSPIRLFSTGEDDGQEIGQIQFGPGHQSVYFVHGNGPNRQGEIPNPASYIQYPSRQLMLVTLKTPAAKALGAYPGALLVPDGKSLLVPQGNRLSRLDPSTGKTEQIAQMRGSFGDLAIHPGSGKILFTSNRGDHSFIGYLDPGQDKSIHWVAPSLYRDGNPVWSPDGQHIAFIRLPGVQRGELTNITGGMPFSILRFDLESGLTTELWRSPGDDGGFAQYYPSTTLQWTSTGQLLFYSEHEGWMKIYRLDPQGGAPAAVLPGACEVEHQSVSPDGHTLIVSSNCGDIDRRDLTKIDVTSGQTTTFLQTPDIETDPVALSNDRVAYRKAGATYPTAIYLWNGNQEQRIYPPKLDAAFPASALVTPEQVIFETPDHWQIHGQLFRPTGKANGGALIFMHGGPIRQMVLGYHYSSYYANAYAMNQYLANLGYVVMSVNYRSGVGYGKLFRRAPQQGPRGAAEYQDIVAAAHYLQSLPGVDARRIGLWGGSYGGYLTAMGLARNSDLFKAGVDLHGVHDWAWRATDFSPGGAWGIDDALMDDAYAFSPISEVGKWRSPVLIIHGDDDRNVMFGQSIDLARKLDAHRVPYEVLVLPDEVHGFLRYHSWLEAYQQGADFFNKHLLKN